MVLIKILFPTPVILPRSKAKLLMDATAPVYKASPSATRNVIFASVFLASAAPAAPCGWGGMRPMDLVGRGTENKRINYDVHCVLLLK